MNCPECSEEAIFISLSNQKKEYFCPKCKINFLVDKSSDDEDYDEIEIDNSEFELEDDQDD